MTTTIWFRLSKLLRAPSSRLSREINGENFLVKINVTIPVYNRPKLIGQAIRNALNLENADSVTVVSDGSDVETHEAILAFKGVARLSYLRIERNAGAETARNLSLLLSNYEWISFHDSDDLYDRRKLSKQFACAVETNSDIALTRFIHFDLAGNLSVRGNKIRLLQDLHTNVVFENNHADYILINPGLFSRRVFEKIGGFLAGRIGGDDDLQYRAVLSGQRICFIEEPLILKLDQSDSITAAPDAPLDSTIWLNFYDELRRNIERIKKDERAAITPIDLPENLRYETVFTAPGARMRFNGKIPVTARTKAILTEHEEKECTAKL